MSTCAGNTESGVVADCGSKELLVVAMMITVNMKMMMMVKVKMIRMLKLMALNQFNGKIASKQGGRTWQAFGGGKNGYETFRQARIYNFRDKCVVFARNLKFSNLTQ